MRGTRGIGAGRRGPQRVLARRRGCVRAVSGRVHPGHPPAGRADLGANLPTVTRRRRTMVRRRTG